MTIYDIAKLANVSPRTVTRAFQKDSPINAKTREEILRIAEENGYRPNNVAARVRGRTLSITAVSVESVEVFKDDILRGFGNARDLLKDLKADVRILNYPDIEHFRKAAPKLLADKPDGFVFASGNAIPSDVRPLFIAQELPVITVCLGEEKTSDSFRLGDVSEDMEMKGRLAGNLLALLCPCGRLCVFSGDLDTAHHQAILRGFRAEAEKSGFSDYPILNTKDDPDIASRLAEECMSGQTPFDGVFFASANSVSAIEQFRSHGFHPVIVASDLFPKMSDYLRDGTVQATVFQNPEKQAHIAVMNMYSYLAEGRTPERLLKITPQLVLRSNLSVYESDETVKI